MRKILKNKDLNERSASRTLLAVALTASLATIGCTTNWNRGNGESATGSTNVNSPSATPGSSGGTVPQPMTSSSRLTNSPQEALAIMQQTLPTTRGRVLGPVNPPATGAARVASNESMQFDGTHQRLTINSSIANPLGPQSAIVSGAAGGSDAGAIFSNTTVTGTTAPVTAAGSTGAVTATTASTPAITTATTAAATPISAALPITSGSLAAGTGSVTPTASSSVVPSATASTSAIRAGTAVSSSNGNTTVATSSVRTTTPQTSGQATALRLNRATVGTTSSAGLSVRQSASGKVVISNVK